MTKLAPAALLALSLLAACSRAAEKSPLPENLGDALQPAFITVYGQPAPVEREVTRDGKPLSLPFRPALIADLGGGMVALVSRAETKEGCQDCAWAVSVAYLRAGEDNRFTVIRQWPDLIHPGPLDDPPHMRVRKGLFEAPALESETAMRDRGCEKSHASFWELTPGGPVLRVSDVNTARNNIPMGAMRTGPLVDYNAHVIEDKAGKRIRVAYQGTITGETAWSPGPDGTWRPEPGGFKPPEC